MTDVELEMSDADYFLCDECSKTFSKAWGLKQHKRIHSGLKKCSHCSKIFPGQHDLEEHKLAEHQNGEYSAEFKAEAVKMAAEVGLKKTASILLLHESTLKSWITDDDGNYCSECHKYFKFDSYLKNHMKLHKEGKSVKTFKEKRFSGAFKSKVVDHVKLYSVKSAAQVFGLGLSTVRSILKANSFPCNLCKRKCAYRGQLQRHMFEVHKVQQFFKLEKKISAKKTFPCTICERKCAYKEQLKRHMLIHTVHTTNFNDIALGQNGIPQQAGEREMASHSEIRHKNSTDMFASVTPQLKDAKSKSDYVLEENSVSEETENTKSEFEHVISQNVAPEELESANNYNGEIEHIINENTEEQALKHTKSESGYVRELEENLEPGEVQNSKSELENVREENAEPKRIKNNNGELEYVWSEFRVPEEIKNTKFDLENLKKEDATLNGQNLKEDMLNEREGEVKYNTNVKIDTKKRRQCEKNYEHKGKVATKEMMQHLGNLNEQTNREQKGINPKREKLNGKSEKRRDRKEYNFNYNLHYKRKGKTCDHCGAITTELKRHLVKHEKVKPFKCDQCEKAFGLIFNLKRHVERNHNPEVEFFSCSKCAQRLTTKGNLLRHEAKHHEIIVRSD